MSLCGGVTGKAHTQGKDVRDVSILGCNKIMFMA